MITVNGWCAGGKGGRGKGVGECSVNGGDGERLLFNLFLIVLTEGAVTTEAGSLFHYTTTLTENADTILLTNCAHRFRCEENNADPTDSASGR